MPHSLESIRAEFLAMPDVERNLFRVTATSESAIAWLAARGWTLESLQAAIKALNPS